MIILQSSMLQQLIQEIQGVSALEWVSTVSQIASVWFARNNHVLVFPTGMLGVVLAFWLYLFVANPPLYAEAWLHLYYLGMSAYGWYAWLLRKTDQSLSYPVSWCENRERKVSVLAALTLWGTIYAYLYFQTDSNTAGADACVTALSVLGMWWMARRKIENWLAYMISNAVAIPLNYAKDLTLFALMYGIFFFMAWSGFNSWRRRWTARAS